MYSPITLLIPEDVTAINDNCCDFQSKEKERRLKMREEKLEQQRIHQEERVRKALERAKADPKKRVRNRHPSSSVEASFELLARVLLFMLLADGPQSDEPLGATTLAQTTGRQRRATQQRGRRAGLFLPRVMTPSLLLNSPFRFAGCR